MWPGRIASPSRACVARSGPFLLRISGRTLRPSGGMWQTTNRDAGNPGGRYRTSCRRASTPPAEVPTTMMSWPYMNSPDGSRNPGCPSSASRPGSLYPGGGETAEGSDLSYGSSGREVHGGSCPVGTSDNSPALPVLGEDGTDQV